MHNKSFHRKTVSGGHAAVSKQARPFRLSFALLFSIFLLAAVFPAFSQEQDEQNWERITLTGRAGGPEWTATSVLESDNPLAPSRYGPEKALDGKAETSWVEGASGAGIGESFFLAFSEYPDAIGIQNGYAKNQDLFQKNHRPSELSIQILAAVNVDGFAARNGVIYDMLPLTEKRSVTLKDSLDPQKIKLPFETKAVLEQMKEFLLSDAVRKKSFPQAKEMGIDEDFSGGLNIRYIISLEIASVYQGWKYEDTCIAELWPDYGRPARVEISNDHHNLLITTPDRRRIATRNEEDSILTLEKTSSNNKWAILSRKPENPDHSGTAADYSLVHTPSGRDMTEHIFSSPSTSGTDAVPLGFLEETSQTLVEYMDPYTGEVRKTRCMLYE